MMGLPSWLHWLGWYVTVSFTCAVIVLIMTLVLIFSKVFPYVDPFVLFLTLFLYSLSIISFNFALSTLFSNRKSSIFYPIQKKTNAIKILNFSSKFGSCPWDNSAVCNLASCGCCQHPKIPMVNLDKVGHLLGAQPFSLFWVQDYS